MNINSDDKDILFGDDFVVSSPNIAKLNEDNKFELNNTDDDIISDSEFNDLLNKLGISSKKEEPKPVKINKEQEQFDIEKEFATEKLRIEYDLLQIARLKFEREKKAWETLKKISEQNLKAEREEFEAYKEREMKRVYLESQKLVDGCKDLKELFEKYKSQ
jgi:hypothetical protein